MELLTTKLHRPTVRPDAVYRPQLLARLDKGLRHARPLTLVSAPAGYGKTTLIAAWLQNKEEAGAASEAVALRTAWLTVGAGDNDPLRFFFYLLAALETAGLRLQAVARYLDDLSEMPPAPSLVTMLLNQVHKLAENSQLLLVLDDYHKIHNTVVHDSLQFWLDNAPGNLHLVLNTREDPPLTLSRWRVRDQMTEIRAQNLRFSRDEAAAFFNQSMALGLTDQEISTLEARTEGWVAGLQLAAVALQSILTTQESGSSAAAFITNFSGSHHYLIDYLVSEVLQKQNEEVRAFLQATAVLDRFSAPLCNAVTGREDSEQILAYLEERNLFLVPLDYQHKWYRYHQLFADSLRASIEPSAQQQIHRRASAWFAEQRRYGEAIRHAQLAGDEAELARLIRLAVEPAFERGDIRQVAAWLAQLPRDMVITDPFFAIFWLLRLMLTGRSSEVPAAIGQVERHARSWTDARDQARLLVLKAWAADLIGAENHSELARQAAAALEPDDVVFRAFVAVPLGHALVGEGQLSAAIEIFQDGLALYPTRGPSLVRISLLSNLIFALNFAGKRQEAMQLCRTVIDNYVDAHGDPLPTAGLPYLVSAWLHYDANQLAEAGQALDIARNLLRQAIGETILTPVEFELDARLHEAAGQTAKAREVLHAGLARAEAQRYQHGVQALTLIAAEHDLRHNRPDVAWQTLEALSFFAGWQPGSRKWREVKGPEDTPYLVYVRLLLAKGYKEEARALLPLIETSARAGGRGRNLITVLLLQAVTQTEPQRFLQEALRLAAAEQYLRRFIDECSFPAHGRHLLRLLQRDATRKMAPAFVESVLAAVPAGESAPLPDAGAAQALQLLEPLTEQELVIVRLLAEGQTNQEIADELVITIGTAKWHVHNIYQKLDVGSRAEAVARIHEWGLANL